MSRPDRRTPGVDEYDAYKERFRNWGRWGEDDQLGTLNHITREARIGAAALVREGRSISLANPLATSRILAGQRNPSPAEHRIDIGANGCGDYIGVAYHGFANTHVDALCHIFTDDRRMYGGRPASGVTAEGARTNSIEYWRDGIVARGVLYDVPRHRGASYVTAERPVHGWELEDVAGSQGIAPRPGDAVLVRMGADAFWSANPDFEPAWRAPGLHVSALEFLYQHDAALLGWDLMEAPGQDQYRAPALPIHSIGIPYMGLALLDNANLEALALTCAELRRWCFLLVIAPLVVVGGTGSPVNPIAVF